MLTEMFAVVTSNDHKCVLQVTTIVELLQQPANLVVHVRNQGVVGVTGCLDFVGRHLPFVITLDLQVGLCDEGGWADRSKRTGFEASQPPGHLTPNPREPERPRWECRRNG